MNQWNNIRAAYFRESTQLRIFRELWRNLTNNERWFIGLVAIVFLGALITSYYSKSVWWLLLAAVSEGGFFIKLESFRNKLIFHEYGSSENISPLSNDKNQFSRYLLFKKQLNEQGITNTNISDCFDLIDWQIEIESSDPAGIRKASTFSFGILAGIFAALWKQLDIKALLLIVFSMVMVILFLNLIAILFPANVERLRELKYFMLLYRCEKT